MRTANNPRLDLQAHVSTIMAGGCRTEATKAFKAVNNRIKGAAARLAPALPEDLREDVAQQFWLIVVQRSITFDDMGKCTFATVLKSLTIDAIRTVIAGNAPAGVKRRDRSPAKDRKKTKPLSEVTAAPTQEVAPDVQVELAKAEGVGTADVVEKRILVQEILMQETPEVVRACWAIAEGAPISTAAESAGLSRFQMARKLKHLRAAAHLAA
ncbi:hypothetical protein [Teichococcus vastitatis]|uniref:Uncharacterized protein n=1 Tax=Teichococcus vastitatis TaxID=2307076 RepID=A0ABS9WAW9_9PROT|nr:hypothetical protein [Pseudoroseomonas vastitatis]MCI0755739.1 hypothetical protein [Pseudoroseomonas vastitatis]